MKVSEMFGSGQFLTQKDIPPAPGQKVTIKDVRVERMHTDEGTKEKVVVEFAELDKCLVLNKTNADLLASYLGDDMYGWYSCPTVIFADPAVTMMGKVVGGLRLRQPKDYQHPDQIKQHKQEQDVPF